MKGKKAKGTLVLLFIILAMAIALYSVFRPRKTGDRVTVTVRGERVAEFSLLEDGVHTLNGGTNTLEIKNGRARMTEADCPDRICVKEGWVSRMGECITCLPNKLVVEVVKENDTVDLVI